MTIVATYNWESDTFEPHADETPTRATWREAVAAIAAKAKAALPQCNGRVDAAAKIVLAGDVELLADGQTKVASQSHGTTTYVVCNGTCECKDFTRAPQGWCKHRLSVAIYKRATALARQQLAQLDDSSTDQVEPPPQPAPAAVPPVLPEAPASVNVRLTLHGREVQVTLRDSDEGRLLGRLEALLARYEVQGQPTTPPPEGWCHRHGLQMRQNRKDGRAWWSHRTEHGWCKGV